MRSNDNILENSKSFSVARNVLTNFERAKTIKLYYAEKYTMLSYGHLVARDENVFKILNSYRIDIEINNLGFNSYVKML